MNDSPAKIMTIIYTNSPSAWDRFTVVKRWSDQPTPFETSNERSTTIFPYLGGVLTPSDAHNPHTYPKQLICCWLEDEMFDADYRAAHPDIDYSDAILVN